MSDITPKPSISAALSPIGGASSGPIAPAGQLRQGPADADAITGSWFEKPTGPLIDIDPPAHFRGMSTEGLANEVLRHIMS